MKHKLGDKQSIQRRLQHAHQSKINRLRASDREVWNAALEEAVKAIQGKPSLAWLVEDILALKATEAA